MRCTLVLVLFLPLPLAAQSADEKKATIQFIASLQQPDGGFIAGPLTKASAAPRSSLRATSAAVRAIKYFGGEVPNKDKTIQFVKSCYSRESHGFADRPEGEADVTSTAVGMMAAAELYKADLKEQHLDDRCTDYLVANAKTFEERRLAVAGMEAVRVEFPSAVRDWLTKIRNEWGQPHPVYGKARDTGGVIAMFLRTGEKLSDPERKMVIGILQAGQRPDGGFGKPGDKGSDGETTYRVMRAFHLLKEQPKDVAKVKEFFAKCRNSDGGYGVTPGQPSTVSGAYYAAAVGHWLAE
jgi:hypothetical protein